MTKAIETDLTLDIELQGHWEPYDRGSWDEPPSGGYFEDFKILLVAKDLPPLDITAYISESQKERLHDDWAKEEIGED